MPREKLLRPDSMVTLMTGTLSAALAIFVLAVTVSGFLGVRNRWNEPQPIEWSKSKNSMYYFRLCTWSERGRVGRLCVPGEDCILIWAVGALLIVPGLTGKGITRSAVRALILHAIMLTMAAAMAVCHLVHVPSFLW